MKKFWHLLFHSWGRWQPITIRLNEDIPVLVTETISGQTRFCIICNKQQIRKSQYQ